MLDTESFLLGIAAGGGGGGGNPNYVETITGTIANPFGDYSVEELASQLLSNEITMYTTPQSEMSLVMEFHALTDNYIEAIGRATMDNRDFFILADYAPTYFENIYYSPTSNDTYNSGILPYDLGTVLTIIHHPLP